MSNKIDFTPDIREKSIFQYRKMDEKDLILFKEYNIKNWDNKDFDDESILKWGYWVINKNRDMFLKEMGGGSCEIPEMYTFVYKGTKNIIECGGGGNRARIYTNNEDGTYNETLLVSYLGVSTDRNDIIRNIAEAFAILSYRDSNKLNRFSFAF